MKIIMCAVLSLPFAFLGFGCAAENKNQPPRNERVNQADVKANPIRHEQLTEEQLRRIGKLHETFTEVDKSSLEALVDNFKREVNPDKEIAVRERIANAYANYISRKKLSLRAKTEIYRLLPMCSTSPEEELFKVFQSWTPGEIREICQEL